MEMKLTMPKQYAQISADESRTILGGIGPTAYDEGAYDQYQGGADLTFGLFGYIERALDLNYSERRAMDRGLGLLGLFQVILNAFNPTAIAEAINIAPFFTGIFNALGQIGLNRL